MITFVCPRCRQVLSLPEEAAKRSSRCPRCGQISVAGEMPSASISVTPGTVSVSAPAPAPVPSTNGQANSQGPASSAAEPAQPGTVSIPATRSFSPPSSPPTVEPPAPKGPTGKNRTPQVPGYEMMEELGRGAMGVVWKARQVGLNRLVALKMLRTGTHAGSQHRVRFKTEAEALARLQHPNIVPIHEVGEANGLPYFAMEFYTGGTLAKQLRGQPLPAREAAKVVSTLARAMHQAHQAGVLHRDLKPSNILLAADGSPRIADFGLAKLVDGAQGPTVTGTVLGTPSYMAPEQASGQTRDIGPTADVYSLGAVLYQLLTGRAPFRGANAHDTLMQVLGEEPVPPSRLHTGMSRDLETICLKCLAKAPARRYASAAELADDLDRYLAGEPIQARSISPVMRFLLWARRRPSSAALVILLAVLGLVVAGGFLWFAGYEQSRRQEAENLGKQAEEARQTAADAQQKAEDSRQSELAARTAAAAETQAAEQSRRHAQRQNAELYLAKGRDLCDGGNIRLGLLWITTSILFAPNEPEFQRIARLDLAGWQTRLNPTLKAWLPHDHVHAIAFSSDGKRVASGKARYYEDSNGEKGTVVLHDLEAGKSSKQIPMGDYVGALAWSADNQRVAVGSGPGYRSREEGWGAKGPGQVHILDFDQATFLGASLPHPMTVRTVAWHPNGQMLLTGCQDGSARLWDLAGNKVLHEIKLGGPVVAVAFAPDPSHMITAVQERGTGPKGQTNVQVWDAGSGKPVEGKAFVVDIQTSSAAFRRDGKALVLASYNSRIVHTDPASPDFGKPLGKQGNKGEWAVAISDDASLMATCGTSWQCHVFRSDTGAQFGQTLHLNGWTYAVAFSPDGKVLATGDNAGIALWNLVSPSPETRPLPVDRVHNLAFSPDLSRLAALLDGNRLQLFDTATGAPWGKPMQHPTGISRFVVGPDNRTVLTGCFDRRVRLWNAETGEVQGKPWDHDEAADALALSGDGRFAVTGTRSRKAQVWDTATGTKVGNVLMHEGEVSAAALSHDGSRVVTGDSTFRIHSWDVKTSQRIGPIVPLTGRPTCLSFSRDARRGLVGTSGDNVVRVIELETGQTLGPPMLHPNGLTSAVFSQNEELIATGVWGTGAARLWDARSGKPLGPPVPHEREVPAVGFGADGKTLVSVGLDRKVIITPIPAPPEGTPQMLNYQVYLQVGMILDRNFLERNVTQGNWVYFRNELQKLKASKP